MINEETLVQAIAWRRHLHRNPELAFEETGTATMVKQLLESWGISVSSGYGVTGLIGTLKRGTSARAIAIRADMDALPIVEETALSYSSASTGKMHACGHDGHVAMLLAAAKVCSELPNLDGTVHFIFQSAEEDGGGAKCMIEDGLFRDFPVDQVFAMHNWPDLDAGYCVARDGAMMAAAGPYEITITGRGGHGAIPHKTIDPIPAACAIVTALQTIVSRNVSPMDSAVVTVGRLSAGHANNVIPDACVIAGTTRWFDPEVGLVVERRMKELCESIAQAFNCSCELNFVRGYPPTINNPAAAALLREVAEEVMPGKVIGNSMAPSMAAEDFSYMLQAQAGCYFWLGTKKDDDNHSLHSPKYDFNDDTLEIGASVWVGLVKKVLRGFES